jgi:hypothetical protein
MNDASSPSPRLVEQRIRNRIIEYFELASSFEAQMEYQSDVSIAWVPDEVIEMWNDLNPVDQSRWRGRLTDPYSVAEIDAMLAFHQTWEWVIANTPRQLPPLPALQQTPQWQRLRDAAETALRPFSERGRMPEDREI